MPRVRLAGAANGNWGGAGVTLEAKHARIRTVRGKPSSCVWGCDATKYQWANLTGDYDDIWDFAAMCQNCHRRYDQARASMEPGFTRHPWGSPGMFTADQVREMRSRRASGTRLIDLAREHGVSLTHMSNIVRGEKYAWVRERQ